MKRPITQDRRRSERRNVAYYLPVLDTKTGQVLGHLVDISPVGIMMDAKIPIPTNVRYSLRLDFLETLGGKSSLNFSATSKWCHKDEMQPFVYNAGFELADIALEDIEVFKLVAEKYGAN